MKPPPDLTVELSATKHQSPWNNKNPGQKLPLNELHEIPKGTTHITINYINGKGTTVHVILLKDHNYINNEFSDDRTLPLELAFNRMEFWVAPEEMGEPVSFTVTFTLAK